MLETNNYKSYKTFYKKWPPAKHEVWYSIKADRFYVIKRGNFPPPWYTYICNL